MQTSQTLLVPYAAADMFDLIDDVERYPEFLPWCAGATLVKRTDALTVGTLDVNWLGARFSFTTRNPKQRPDWMLITLQSGPFRELNGEWRFHPLGKNHTDANTKTGAEAGTKISLTLNYRFDNALMSVIAAPVFGRIAHTMADAFAARARVLAASGRLQRPSNSPVSSTPAPDTSSISPTRSLSEGIDHE